MHAGLAQCNLRTRFYFGDFEKRICFLRTGKISLLRDLSIHHKFIEPCLRAYSGYIRHETFSFMMSLPAMSPGLRFCVSRKGGTGGGRWVHPKGANSMAASGLIFRSDLVGTGRAISILILFGINGVKNKRSHLVGPPFPEFKARFSATAGWHFS